MKRHIIVGSLLLITSFAIAQSKKDTVICKGLQAVSARSSISNFPFDKTLSISKEFFKNGFTLVCSDPNWKVDGFWYDYECEGCDIYRKQVLGNTVNTTEHFIFKKLRKGEVLDFYCVNIARNGNRYLAQGFSVVITD